jgi:hypothetical protein
MEKEFDSASQIDLEDLFKDILCILTKSHEKKPIVLIDEYDRAIYEFYETMKLTNVINFKKTLYFY